jgi:hypothetical protein
MSGKKRYIRGLIPSLKRTFYPTFKRAPNATRNSSKKLGIRVHKEMEHITIGKTVKRPHTYTKQLLACLKKLNLIPIAAEVPILSYYGAFLTRSDLICRHIGRDDIVVVSLKTGSSLGYTRGQGDCKNLSITNCVKTHHQLQLACEVSCIEREYEIPVAASFVIYAGFGKNKKARIDPLLPIFKTPGVRTAINKALLTDAMKSRATLPNLVI